MNQIIDPDLAAANALRLIGPDRRTGCRTDGYRPQRGAGCGGQTGSALAFALRRAGIGKVSVIDAADDEIRAGVWLTAARMNLLRTPKSLPGPEQGIPALSFQSWFEARRERPAYTAMDRIPRLLWAEYLQWYRSFLGVAVRYRTRLLRIEQAEGHFRLHLDIEGRAKVETTRKIVLATGFTGNAGAYVPPPLAGLPPHVFAHTQDNIDFCRLAWQDSRRCRCRKCR